jgi:hypothetical protein
MILEVRFKLVPVTKNGLISGFPQILPGLNEEVRLFDLNLEGNEALFNNEPPIGSFPVIVFRPFGLRSHEEFYSSATCPMRRNFS